MEYSAIERLPQPASVSFVVRDTVNWRPAEAGDLHSE